MLHDLIGVSQDKLDDFLANTDSHLILSGGIWRHSKRTALPVSLCFDKHFDEQFKRYVHSKNPQTGAFARMRIYKLIEPHRNNRFALIADVKKYFENIAYEQLIPLIAGSSELVSHSAEIEKVYFHNGYLKRGLVASPAISEVVGIKIDEITKQLIYKMNMLKGTHYSRYYDDIVISNNDKEGLEKLQIKLTAELKKQLGLNLNQKKTQVRPLSGTKVLGLSFHNGEITPPKSFKANLRAAEHQYYFMSEDELEEVYAKLSQAGTIYASYHRIINSSSADTSPLNSKVSYYHDELYRLHELYEHFLQQRFEETGL
jgi:hypothetical protein